MRTSVCLSSRSLLLPAGAGGRHGEHRHLPHLVLPLGPDLARDDEPPPPQQQQQQVDFNLQPPPPGHKSMMWPSKDYKQGEGERSIFSWFENTGCQQSPLSLFCSGSAEFITKGLTYVIFRHLQRILLLYWHLNYWLGYSGTLIPSSQVYPRIYFCVQMRTIFKVKAAACTIQINGNNLDSS